MVKKILTFAVGLILTVAFITMLTQYFNTGKRSSEGTMAQANLVLETNADVMLAQYKEGAAITGVELRNLIQTKPSNVTIKVQTGKMKANVTPIPAAAFGATELSVDKYDNMYINPNKTYSCTANTTNGNGVITSLTFVQQ